MPSLQWNGCLEEFQLYCFPLKAQYSLQRMVVTGFLLSGKLEGLWVGNFLLGTHRCVCVYLDVHGHCWAQQGSFLGNSGTATAQNYCSIHRMNVVSLSPGTHAWRFPCPLRKNRCSFRAVFSIS